MKAKVVLLGRRLARQLTPEKAHGRVAQVHSRLDHSLAGTVVLVVSYAGMDAFRYPSVSKKKSSPSAEGRLNWRLMLAYAGLRTGAAVS